MAWIKEMSWGSWLGVAALAAVPLLALLYYMGAGANGEPASRSRSSDAGVQGKAIYDTVCAGCHGPKGEGQTGWQRQNADGSYPPPPHNNEGHTWHHGDGTLFATVQQGGQIFEQPGFVSRMPAYGSSLSAEQIKSVISYIKTFWGPEELHSQQQQSLRDPFSS
ncbi:MAG: cytochrome c [Chloroflexi bacterium]|nr:cytochrome c [Chloroflexota bacterium]